MTDITWPDKNTGDTYTADEVNETKEAVNSKTDTVNIEYADLDSDNFDRTGTGSSSDHYNYTLKGYAGASNDTFFGVNSSGVAGFFTVSGAGAGGYDGAEVPYRDTVGSPGLYRVAADGTMYLYVTDHWETAFTATDDLLDAPAGSNLYADAVAVWDFESGALADDTKGTHNGTAMNGPTSSSDVCSTANGTGSISLTAASLQYVEVPDSSDFDLQGDFAIAFRVKLTTGNNQPPINKMSSTDGWLMRTVYITDSVKFRFDNYNSGSPDSADSGVAVGTGDWETVVMSFDSDSSTDNVTFWITSNGGVFGDIVNGTTGSIGTMAPLTDAPLWMGRNGYSSQDQYLNGLLDEVSMWNREITSIEAEAFTDGTWRT